MIAAPIPIEAFDKQYDNGRLQLMARRTDLGRFDIFQKLFSDSDNIGFEVKSDKTTVKFFLVEGLVNEKNQNVGWLYQSVPAPNFGICVIIILNE